MKVSPADKSSADITPTVTRIRAAPAGDAVSYTSMGAFSGAPGTGQLAQYMARVSGDRWSTKALNPLQQTNQWTHLHATTFRDFSDDLRVGVLRAAEPQPDPLAPANTNNLFVRDSESGTVRVVTSIAPPGADFRYEPFYAGASDDFSKVYFESTGALTSNAPADGATKLYVSDNGAISLVGVLPDRSPAPSGSVAGAGASASGGYSLTRTRRAVSADGSRIAFTSGDGRIYLREAGDTTFEVSPGPARFRAMSRDGSKVIFTSDEQLAPDDTDALPDLYVWDRASQSIGHLSRDIEPDDGLSAGVQGVVGASDDGEKVYFTASGALVPDADAAAAMKLYLSSGGRVRFVGPLESSTFVDRDVYNMVPSAAVTPNGRYVLFATAARVGTYDNDGFSELYVYDSEMTDAPHCISCTPSGRSPESSATLGAIASGAGGTIERAPRLILDDGSKAFFQTAEPLVPTDSNGRIDVYEYDAASRSVALISSGQDDDDSFFGDASADGRDVFFTTRARLVAADTDGNLDLYDARVAYTPPAPPPEPSAACIGDDCQGPLSVPPVWQVPVTEDDFDGSRNADDVPSPVITVQRVTSRALARAARTGVLVVTVQTPVTATVSATASARIRGLEARVASAARRGRGTVRLRLRLVRQARRQLASAGRIVIRVSLRNSANAEDGQSMRLVLRRRATTRRSGGRGAH
jgi:Tol biopolymer transport system component